MVSIKDYLNTDVVKGFTSVDDVEKSDYQRVRHGKLEQVHNKVTKTATESRELKCGCSVNIPKGIKPYSEDEEDYMREKGLIKDKQTGVSSSATVCGQCHKTLSSD